MAVNVLWKADYRAHGAGWDEMVDWHHETKVTPLIRVRYRLDSGL